MAHQPRQQPCSCGSYREGLSYTTVGMPQKPTCGGRLSLPAKTTRFRTNASDGCLEPSVLRYQSRWRSPLSARLDNFGPD